MSTSSEKLVQSISLSEAISNLKKSLLERVNVQALADKDRRQQEVNRYLKEQRVAIQNASKQIQAVLNFKLDIDAKQLLMNEETKNRLQLLSSQTVKEVDVDAAQELVRLSREWAQEVIDKVNKVWDTLCEQKISLLKRNEVILKSIKKFAPHEVSYNSIRSSLEGNRRANLFSVHQDFIQKVEDFVSKLDKEVKDLGKLPDNISEFFSEAQSVNGFDFEKFNLESNDNLRKTLKEWGFYPNLTLRIKD